MVNVYFRISIHILRMKRTFTHIEIKFNIRHFSEIVFNIIITTNLICHNQFNYLASTLQRAATSHLDISIINM